MFDRTSFNQTLGSILGTIVVDTILLALCVPGFYQLREKAGLAEFRAAQNLVVVVPFASAAEGLQTNDKVHAIDGRSVVSTDQVEFICDGHAIGDSVDVDLERSGSLLQRRVPLGHCYDTTYFGIILFAGLVFIGLGTAVVVKRPDNEAARVFHWILLSATLLVEMSPGRYTIPPLGIGHLVRICYGIALCSFPVLFVEFTTVFPYRKWIRGVVWTRALRLIAFLLATVYAVTFLFGTIGNSAVWQKYYFHTGNAVEWFFVIVTAVAIGNFIHTYATATPELRRRKLRWVFAGIAIGPGSLVTLFYGPQQITGIKFVNEQWLIIFAACSAVLFAVGIVRHRVLDIEFIVTRGTVYGIVLVALATLYVGVVAGLAAMIGATATFSIVPTVVATAMVALLFAPVRIYAQRVVDKRFYRVRYDYRVAQRGFVEEIANSLDVHSLATLCVRRIDTIIPVERIGFFTLSPSGTRLRVEAHIGMDILERHGVPFAPELLRTSLPRPVAREGHVEAGLDVEPAEAEMFDRWGLALVFPMRSEQHVILGFLALGSKRAGIKYTMEDIDLLRAVSLQAGLTLERTHLRELLLIERAESQRLEELNTLKSYFVSSVSHELKTPLTSIRMFAELLDSNEHLSRETVREYLRIIEGESARLARLIDNVLDFANIERGTKEYQFVPVQLNDIVAYVMRAMQYQFTMQHCSVEAQLDGNAGVVCADADAVAEAVINLLSNALKYSRDIKQIQVETTGNKTHTGISVRDRGMGIALEDRERVFEPFFRSSNREAQRIGGTGLGLTLVRHIMQAHGGYVELDSAPGEGSTVTLWFPQHGNVRSSS